MGQGEGQPGLHATDAIDDVWHCYRVHGLCRILARARQPRPQTEMVWVGHGGAGIAMEIACRHVLARDPSGMRAQLELQVSLLSSGGRHCEVVLRRAWENDGQSTLCLMLHAKRSTPMSRRAKRKRAAWRLRRQAVARQALIMAD